MDTTSAVHLYTDIGPKYQDAFIIPDQLRSIEALLSLLPPHSRILDIGCGTGKPAAKAFLEAGHSVTGIDITPTMIDIAKKQFPGNANCFTVADFRTWEPSPAGEKFDCVVSYYAFLTGVSPQDIRAFFPRAYKWLKPGGFMAFGTGLTPDERDEQEVEWLGRKMRKSSLTAEALIEVVRETGFEIVKEERASFTPRRAVEVGICREEELKEERHLSIIGRKLE